MKRWSSFVVGWFVIVLVHFAALPAKAQDALLVVAHGSRQAEWNERVIRLVNQVDWPGPKGVAFLMDAPPDHALDRVAAQLDQAEPAPRRIIVVPLLVSSFSGHYEEIRYYLGQRKEAPAHTHYSPLKTRAELVLAPAMDDHPLVSQILLDLVKRLSKDPIRESVILVAHGPNDDEENERWLERLRHHAERIRKELNLRRIDVVTLRDDAPKPVRDAATEMLRTVVRTASADTHVLVVPVLISVGQIQRQIHERLEGLVYVMSESGLAEHPLAAAWIKQQADQIRGTVAVGK